jgi:hypothetical protein
LRNPGNPDDLLLWHICHSAAVSGRGTRSGRLILPNAGAKPLAIAGIVCGVLAILLSVGLLIIALSNPNALRQWQQMQNR